MLSLVLSFTKIYCQNSISLHILNDTIYFYRTDHKYITPMIDCNLIFEIRNNSSNKYVLFLDTSRITPHHFFKHEMYSKKLKYDHSPNVQSLLLDNNYRRMNLAGGFVSLDYGNDSVNIALVKDLIISDSLIIADYINRGVKLDRYQILENYRFNNNKLYLSPYKSKKILVRMRIPFIDVQYLYTYDLDKKMNYFLDFFFYNNANKIEYILTKSEKKILKSNNYKIFNGKIHSNKIVPLIFKEIQDN